MQYARTLQSGERASAHLRAYIPILFANLDVGHIGTYGEDNGGGMGELALAWLRWHLLDDQGATGKGAVVGSGCGLCNADWDLRWKMEPK